MKELKMYNTCFYLHDLFSFPIRIKNKTLNHSIPSIWTPFDFTELLEIDIKMPSYHIIGNALFIGFIPIKELEVTLCIGPISEKPLHKTELTQLTQNLNLSLTKHDTLIQLLQSIPSYSFHYFLYIISFIHYLMNNEKIDTSEINTLKDSGHEIKLNSIFTEEILYPEEHNIFHDTYDLEKMFLGIIEKGDTNYFLKFHQEFLGLKTGTLATSSLRHTKNLFIASITLATRAAIKGGLENETAYLLSDLSIQEMEKLNDLNSINKLQQLTIYSLIERVARTKTPQNTSLLVKETIKFISKNLSNPINVNIISKAINVNRSYLSRIFKLETGKNLSSYILEKKLSQACDLLVFSSMPINEISEYLNFSNQSHFQKTFKKHYTLTPANFRKLKGSNI